ncbi:MAG: hypothetical protein IJW23_09640 [Lentisphaeria bacterium]|nr:hypothetical protein [Lentisphaeria bacterium]
MTEIFGLPWTLSFAIIAVLLLVLDLFLFQSDILTFIADLIFVPVIVHFIPVDNMLLNISIGVVIYAVILAFHWLVYRKIVKKFLNVIAPQKLKNSNDILIGQTGKICWIEEQTFISVGDECIPCQVQGESPREDLAGKKAVIISWEDKKLCVRLVQ